MENEEQKREREEKKLGEELVGGGNIQVMNCWKLTCKTFSFLSLSLSLSEIFLPSKRERNEERKREGVKMLVK